MGTASLAADERAALRDGVARLLVEHCSQADVRRLMETPHGYDRALYRQLAEMGVVGLLAPEEFGGGGASALELEAVMEEAGAALLGGPLLSSGVLATAALSASGDHDAASRLLPALISGEKVATLAITGPSGSWTEEGIAVEAASAGERWRLDGQADYITHARNAAVLLVVARTEGGPSLFEVDPRAQGVTLVPLQTFDRTLRLSRIEFGAVPATLIGEVGAGWRSAEAALELGRVALAGDAAGGARRIFETTVDYAKTRIQFGRAIGSFQAIKHMAADLLLETESSISAARAAAGAVAEGSKEAPALLSLASFVCPDCYVRTAADAIQMHGGIGFTWEHPAHLYLRRARADAQLFGGSDYHRERYLKQLGG